MISNFLLFLYFVTTSAELINTKLFIFRVKFSFLIGLITLLVFAKQIFIIKRYFFSFLFIFLSILISFIQSNHPISTVGYSFYYTFNYLIYFILPISILYRDPESVLNIYFKSFQLVGTFALFQVLFSNFGIYLPFIKQTFGPNEIARGQGWTYEPSYFALYMTPFIAFQNSKYFLLPEKRCKAVYIYNLMYLASTSTGCLFSYVWMILISSFFTNKHRALQLILSGLTSIFLLFGMLKLISSEIFDMIFKFFLGNYESYASILCRWESIQTCLQIFMEHPITGIGLGGIPSYIAQNYSSGGFSLDDPDLFDLFPAMNITTELLASLGLVGMFGLIHLLLRIYRDFRSTIKLPNLLREEKVNLQAFAISLCTMLFTYQFSQSMMRPYIWTHVAICVGYLFILQRRFSYKIPVLTH